MLKFLVLQIFVDVIGESEKEKIKPINIIKATEKKFSVVRTFIMVLQRIYLNE